MELVRAVAYWSKHVCVRACVCEALSRIIIREPLEGSESTLCGRGDHRRSSICM